MSVQDEWELGGPPWGKNRHSYEKHSPHQLAANFRTPMLVIHNDLDFLEIKRKAVNERRE